MRKLPTVTKNLLIINAIVFFASLVAEKYDIDLDALLGLHYFQAADFHVHQLLTYMFMHSGFDHLFFNMFAVFMFGVVLENVWGSQRFLFFYLTCGLGAGLVQEAVQFIQFMPYMDAINTLTAYSPMDLVNIGGIERTSSAWLAAYQTAINYPTVGASGAVYGILLAFGMLFPNQQLFIIPIPVPIKAKWLIIGYFVLELALAFLAKGDHVAHFAHLGGMIFGFLLIIYWRKHGKGYR